MQLGLELQEGSAAHSPVMLDNAPPKGGRRAGTHPRRLASNSFNKHVREHSSGMRSPHVG